MSNKCIKICTAGLVGVGLTASTIRAYSRVKRFIENKKAINKCVEDSKNAKEQYILDLRSDIEGLLEENKRLKEQLEEKNGV